MIVAAISLSHFRNHTSSTLEFGPGINALLGDNGDGKTNILEALYLVATLRSFRGVGSAQLVRHGQKGYFVGSTIVSQGEHEAKMYWSVTERSQVLDGQPVRKLTDYRGVLADGGFLH